MVKRVTMAQVAKLAEVSSSTVSLVFNQVPNNRIPPETARRVLEAADKLGYTPNSAARTLRTGMTHAYGLVSNEVTTTRFASGIISGTLQKAAETKRMVMIAECPDILDISEAVQTLLDRQVDGLLVGLMRAREIKLPKLSLPVGVINGYCQGAFSVLPDEETAGYQAVKYLLERGHQRIGLLGRYLGPIPSTISVTIPKRFVGIDRAMAEAGMEFVWEYLDPTWEPSHGRKGGDKFFKDFPELSATGRGSGDCSAAPTAVICANDRLAFGFYQTLYEYGVIPGRDISIISFDNEDLAKYVYPGLTTMELPHHAMGQRAVEILQGESEEGLMPMRLVERGSVVNLRA